MEQEHELQSSIEKLLGALEGPHAAALDRILHYQHVLLGANIALLEQLYESLPNPERFQALNRRLSPLSKTRRTVADSDSPGILPALVALHLNLTASIDTLLAGHHDIQRGEAFLTEVARNHNEMAWMLTALIREDETMRDLDESPMPGTAEGEWENEGGALQSGALTRRDIVVETP